MKMLKRTTSLLGGLAVTSLLCASSAALADDERNSFKTRLKGFNEVPAVSSTGRGEFSARILGDTIEWTLSYEGLEGTTTTAAHVHVGQRSVNGGVSFFLCSGTGQPACTPGSGSFSGTATAANILGPAAQGVAAGEIAEVIRAMRAGKTYANVHTDKHPGGEIRGDISADDDD
jgi:CHRD domain